MRISFLKTRLKTFVILFILDSYLYGNRQGKKTRWRHRSVSSLVVLPWSGFGIVIPGSMVCSGRGNETAAIAKIKAVWPVSFPHFPDQSPCLGFPCRKETGKCTVWCKCAPGTGWPKGNKGMIVPAHEMMVSGQFHTLATLLSTPTE
jgi:hypothetical protein